MTNTLAFLFGAFLPNKIVITLIQGHALMNFLGIMPIISLVSHQKNKQFYRIKTGVVFTILYS
jgi:hypothetical protein